MSSSQQANVQGYVGPRGLNNDGSDISALWFVVSSLLARVRTAGPVQVVAFHAAVSGGLLAGTVDVKPLVNQIDGMGNATPHGILYGLPYFRLRAGNSAVVIDPVAGDIGLAVFCDRDISAVKRTAAQANPGSRRQLSMADGIYFGGLFGPAPTQYIQMGATGITIATPLAVSITSASLTHNGVNVGATHVHGNVQNGAGETGGPT